MEVPNTKYGKPTYISRRPEFLEFEAVEDGGLSRVGVLSGVSSSTTSDSPEGGVSVGRNFKDGPSGS